MKAKLNQIADAVDKMHKDMLAHHEKQRKSAPPEGSSEEEASESPSEAKEEGDAPAHGILIIAKKPASKKASKFK